MNNSYDILILGSGPIGASTAYFLSQTTNQQIGAITQDPTTDHSATYTQAGGSLRWYWDDATKVEMTKQTADFFNELISQGVDLASNNDHYLFLNRGKYVPSLNFSGAKAVHWFLDEAVAKGVILHEQHLIQSVTKNGDEYSVTTDKGTYQAKKVVLALGVANETFMPGYELEREKRQLFILDLPVTETEKEFPHVVVPIGEGVAYIFIKQTPDGWRFIVGQEDVVEVSEEAGEEQYFDRLLEAGLGDVMPFLKQASVEKIWWGIDAGNKDLRLENQDELYAVNCGSAARSCVWIGRKVAERLAS